MKAIVIHDYGSSDVLHMEAVPDPVGGPGQVLVRVSAAGINPIDTIERAVVMKAVKPLTFPAIIGRDLAGRVMAGTNIRHCRGPRHQGEGRRRQSGAPPFPEAWRGVEDRTLLLL
jgi:NADPH:quinone reductase-like Zn-dependent oxidoreductase